MLARFAARFLPNYLARPITQAGAGGQYLDSAIRALFASGEQGLWLDVSDWANVCFQDSTGSTPVTAVEQPVGLALDKRLGLVLGSELSPNGGTFPNATGWTLAAGHTISGGALVLTAAAANSNSYAATAMVAGQRYLVTYTITSITGEVRMRAGIAGDTGTGRTVPGTYTERLVSAGDGNIQVQARSASNTANITLVSVKHIPGNHASQPTTAQKPVLSARKNKLLATTTMATQSVTLTASPHTLSFKGTGTVTLTGASTAGPLVGTGASNRVSLTFTPSAGSVTFTVSGSVTDAQLENGSAATAYQRVTTATDYDTVGQSFYLKFDGVDDYLRTVFPNLGSNVTIGRSIPGTGASILTGQTIGAGNWDDSTSHCALVIIDRALTGPETALLTEYLNTRAGL